MNENIVKMVYDVPERCVLIDVLSGTSFAREHISGAVNFCVYEVAFLDKVQEAYPDKDQAICLYGWSDESEEAMRAHHLLTHAGYTNLTILTGGLEKWRDDGKPIDSGEVMDQLDGVYVVDTERSRVEWMGRNIGKKHHGTIGIRSGSFAWDHDRLHDGEIVFDMTRIENIDLDDMYKATLITHLKSSDFFDVGIYPEAMLKITSVEKIDAIASVSNYRVKAVLTIKGINKEILFDAFIHYKEGDMVMNAHFDIDRTLWDVKYGSERFFSRMGIHIVDDMISFDLVIFASKK